MTTVTDVEQALINARVLEDYWMSNGWDLLESENLFLGEINDTEEEILDIFPLVEIDVSVIITIKLSTKIYVVPLEDVSPINTNDCLVIGVSDLYPDWEQRVEVNLGTLIKDAVLFSDGIKWYESRYIGEDKRIRVVRLKASSVNGYVPLN